MRELGWRGRRTGELPLSPHRRVTRRLAWLQSGGDEDKAEAVAQSRRNALRSVSPSPGGSISPRPTPALPASPVGDHRAQPELIRPPPHPRGVGWHRRASSAATRQRATGGTGRDGRGTAGTEGAAGAGRARGRVRYLCPSSTPSPGSRPDPSASTRRTALGEQHTGTLPGRGLRPVAHHRSPPDARSFLPGSHGSRKTAVVLLGPDPGTGQSRKRGCIAAARGLAGTRG